MGCCAAKGGGRRGRAPPARAGSAARAGVSHDVAASAAEAGAVAVSARRARGASLPAPAAGTAAPARTLPDADVEEARTQEMSLTIPASNLEANIVAVPGQRALPKTPLRIGTLSRTGTGVSSWGAGPTTNAATSKVEAGPLFAPGSAMCGVNDSFTTEMGVRITGTPSDMACSVMQRWVRNGMEYMDPDTRIDFKGMISTSQHVDCVVSFPGCQKRWWDWLVKHCTDKGYSVACVFYQGPTFRGHIRDPKAPHKDAGDVCYCHALYGAQMPWGCQWFADQNIGWIANVEQAVERNQTLVVYKLGTSKDNWKPVAWTDLAGVNCQKKADGLPCGLRECNDIGMSQNGEVAWLEKMGYRYKVKCIGKLNSRFERKRQQAAAMEKTGATALAEASTGQCIFDDGRFTDMPSSSSEEGFAPHTTVPVMKSLSSMPQDASRLPTQ